MNRTLIARLVGVSKREVYYVRAGTKKNDEVMRLLALPDETFFRQWFASTSTRTMCILAKNHARNNKARLFANRMLKYADLLSASQAVIDSDVRQCMKYLGSPLLECICETAIGYTKDNDLQSFIADLHFMSRRFRGENDE